MNCSCCPGSAAPAPASRRNLSASRSASLSPVGRDGTAWLTNADILAQTTYSQSAGSHYRSAVLDSNPYSYWRMGTAAGATGTPPMVNDAVVRGRSGTWTAGSFSSVPASSNSAT